jgi:peptide/nickel transport system permease protein
VGNFLVAASTAQQVSIGTPRTRVESLRRSRSYRALRANPFGILGVAMLTVVVIAALVPGLLTHYDPVKLLLQNKFLPPSTEHWFGTDDVGRDVYTRVVYGARVTLLSTLMVLVLAAGIGTVAGALAGFYGGWIDTAVMRVTDMFLAFPALILALAINAALGRGLTQAMLAVAISWWPSYARLVRGQVLSTKQEEYVTAARVMGAPVPAVIGKHILLNSFPPILVRMTLDIGFIALTTAGLSFLGLGVEPPTPEWGRMVADGRSYLLDQWWWTTFPGLALFLLVVGSNLTGDVVRESLDPSLVNR